MTKPYTWTKEQDEKLLSLLNSNVAKDEIALTLGRTLAAIRIRIQRIKQGKGFINHVGTDLIIRKRWTKEDKLKVVSMLNEGKERKEIARILDRSLPSIKKCIIRMREDNEDKIHFKIPILTPPKETTFTKHMAQKNSRVYIIGGAKNWKGRLPQ